MYASITPGRILSLKSKIAHNPRGSRSISDYIKDMQSIADSLALAGHPISDTDLIAAVINQLGEDYRPVYSALRVRETSISMDDLSDILQDIERSITPGPDANPLIPPANNTQARAPPPTDGGHGRGFRGRGRGGRLNGRQSFGGRGFSQNWPPNGSNSNPISCEFCSIPGHIARECHKLARFLREHNIAVQNSPSPPNVNSTTMHGGNQPSWLFDSGASHHVTNSPSSMQNFTDFGGPEELYLGNGKTLPISKLGTSSIPTNSRPLSLSPVLYVPDLNCNLTMFLNYAILTMFSWNYFPPISLSRISPWGFLYCGAATLIISIILHILKYI